MPYRVDSSAIGNVERAPGGAIRIPASLTRVGVFEYTRADGSKIRELRPPEEVFHPDSLASLRDAPVTVGHPGVVTASNWRQHSIGHVSGIPTPKEDHVASDVVVQDAQAIDRVVVKKDLREVSCGYACKMDPTPGVWNGERYDEIQREIRYNHVGLGGTGWGRQGSSVALHLDSKGDQLPETKERQMQITIVFDGKTYVVEKGSDEHLSLLDKIQADYSNQVKRADAAEAKATSLTTELATAQTKLDSVEADKAKAARSELEGKARKVLGPEAKFDGLTDREVRERAIVKLDSAVKFDGKSDVYVETLFDLSVARQTESPTDVLRLRNDGTPEQQSERFDEKKAEAKRKEERGNMAKAPLAYSKDR